MDKWEGTCLNKAWVCQGFWGQVVSRCHSTGESVGHGCNLPGGTLCAKGPREEKNQNLLGNVMNPGLKSSTAVEGMCMQPWLTGWRTWDAWFLPKFWLAKGRQTQLLPRSAQGEGSLADEPHLLPFIKNSIHSMWFSAVRHIRKQVLTSTWKVAQVYAAEDIWAPKLLQRDFSKMPGWFIPINFNKRQLNEHLFITA